jgi:hypothetical protein
MASQWYYRQAGNEFGPVTLDFLGQLMRAGQLAPSDWVREGETNPWRPVPTVAQLQAAAAPKPPPPARRPAPSLATAPATPPAVRRPAPPVASAAPAPMPARAPLPAGHVAPVAVAPVAVSPVAVTAVAPAAPHHSVLQERRRHQSPTGMVIGLAVCAIGLLIGGGFIIVMSLSSDAEPEVATNSDGATQPAATSGEASAADATKAGSPAGKLSGEQIFALQAIDDWRDASRAISGLKDIVSFEVKRVYWEGGAPVVAPAVVTAPPPATESETETAPAEEAPAEGLSALEKILAGNRGEAQSGTTPQPDAASPDKPAQTPSAARARLCVEVRITNLSPGSLAYTSWNGQGKAGAWLVDAKHELVAFASGGSGTQQIAKGQDFVDKLIFEVEPKAYEELRLVLPKAATKPKESGYWGLAIGREMLFAPEASEAPPSIAAAPTGEAKPAGETGPAIIAEPKEDDPPGITATQQPPVDDGEPTEDIRDLIRRSKQGEEKPE